MMRKITTGIQWTDLENSIISSDEYKRMNSCCSTAECVGVCCSILLCLAWHHFVFSLQDRFVVAMLCAFDKQL